MGALSIFLHGAATMGFVLAGIFFFRFYARTCDRLFLAFGIAFLLLASSQIAVALVQVPGEDSAWIFIPKLLAFGMIIAAIAAKTLEGTKPRKK